MGTETAPNSRNSRKMCLVDFLALTELLGTVHKISIGLRSGFWAGHSKSLMLATACIPKPVLIYL